MVQSQCTCQRFVCNSIWNITTQTVLNKLLEAFYSLWQKKIIYYTRISWNLLSKLHPQINGKTSQCSRYLSNSKTSLYTILFSLMGLIFRFSLDFLILVRKEGGVIKYLFFKKWLICNIISLHTKFQIPTKPGTGEKVCVRWCGGWWWLKPIIVFSLSSS